MAAAKHRSPESGGVRRSRLPADDRRGTGDRTAPSDGQRTAEPLECDVRGLTHVEIGTVDMLARLALAARRGGCELRVTHASPELAKLLAFVGLADVVGLRPESGLDPGRQAEEREHPRGIEVEDDPADPAR